MHRTLTALAAALFAVLLLVLPIPGPGASAQPPELPDNANGRIPAGSLAGIDAIDRLGDRLPDVALQNGISTAALRFELVNDPSLFVTEDGWIAYAEAPLPDDEPLDLQAAAQLPPGDPPPTDGPEFQLESMPGANHTIYLDFDGHETFAADTRWSTDIVSTPYDRDGRPSSWSAEELEEIRAMWEWVVDDFSMYNLNITTRDPGFDALAKTDAADPTWGVRVVFSRGEPLCQCGGIAATNSFNADTDTPAFVYSVTIAAAGLVAHEVGHTLGLSHDGGIRASDGSEQSTYGGHGSSATKWAPNLGGAFTSVGTNQWSMGEYTGYFGSDNYGAGPDDMAIIGAFNGRNDFGFKPDDHGNTAATATQLTEVGTTDGVISLRDDVDVFVLSHTGGSFSASAEGAPHGQSLDIELTLRDDSGSVVELAEPELDKDASFSLNNLRSGVYTLQIDGVGYGDPFAATPTGYTDYGSVGQYSLTVDFSPGEPPPPPLVMGDVDCNAALGLLDARLVAQYSIDAITGVEACPVPANTLYLPAADVDGSGDVSLLDARLIAQCAVDAVNSLCPA